MDNKNLLGVIGFMVCVIGAIVMVEGHGFGERTTAVAIVLGICGISILATSGGLLQQKKPMTANRKKIMIGLLVATVIAVLITFLFGFLI